MYALINSDTILQGDILTNYHFIVPPTGKPTIVKIDKKQISIIPIDDIKQPYSLDNKETLIANSFLANAMIISQSCDIQRREYIYICPVYKIDNLIQLLNEQNWEEKKINDFLTDLKSQKINYYLHLPSAIFSKNNIQLEESYVDLQVINSSPVENLKNYQRIISLSDKGRHWLGYKLSNLFNRPFI